jgi:hypothetical protein
VRHYNIISKKYIHTITLNIITCKHIITHKFTWFTQLGLRPQWLASFLIVLLQLCIVLQNMQQYHLPNLPSHSAAVRFHSLVIPQISSFAQLPYPKSTENIHHLCLTISSRSKKLHSKTYYIFIHSNRAKLVKKVDKVSQNPMVYNHFLPFVCCSIKHPFVVLFDSLKSSFVACFGPYSNCLLLFDFLLRRSQNLSKMPLQQAPKTHMWLVRATQACFQCAMKAFKVSFAIMGVILQNFTCSLRALLANLRRSS